MNIWFSSSERQQAKAIAPCGLIAVATLANAATGSSKNITPNSEITRSNPAGARAARSPSCTSTTSKRRSGKFRRAPAIIDAEMSAPSGVPPRSATSRDKAPVPQPTSRTRHPASGSAAAITALETGWNTALNVSWLANHAGPARFVHSSRICSLGTVPSVGVVVAGRAAEAIYARRIGDHRAGDGDLDALRRRAEALGAETFYWDDQGNYHDAHPESLRRVVEVLDADASTSARNRRIPPVVVGSGGRIPVGDGIDSAALTVADGTIVELDITAGHVDVADPLPIGCHVLAIAGPGVDESATIVTAPAAMPTSAALAGRAAMFVPAYALWERDAPLPSFSHLAALGRAGCRSSASTP